MDYFSKNAELNKEDYELCGMKAPEVPYDEEIVAYARKICYSLCSAKNRRDMFFIDNLKEINGVEVRCYFKGGIPGWLNLYNSFGPFYFIIQEVSTGEKVFEKVFSANQKETKEEYEKRFLRQIIAFFIELRRALPYCSIKDGELCVDFPVPDWFAAPGAAAAQSPVNNIYIDLQKQDPEPAHQQIGIPTRLFPFIPNTTYFSNPKSASNPVSDASLNYKGYNYYADKESDGTLCFSRYGTEVTNVVPANDTKIKKEAAEKVNHAAETYFRIKKEDEFVAANDVSVTNTLDGGALKYNEYSSGSGPVPVNDIVDGKFTDATKTATYSDISGSTTYIDFLKNGIDCSGGGAAVDLSNIAYDAASNEDIFYNRQFWVVEGIIRLAIDYLKNHATHIGICDIVSGFEVSLNVLNKLISAATHDDVSAELVAINIFAEQKKSLKSKFERIIEGLKKYSAAKFAPSAKIDVQDAFTKICDELNELPELWKFYYNIPDKTFFNFLDRSILCIYVPVFKPATAAQRPPSLIETEIKAFHELIGYKKECPGIIDQKSLDYCTLSWEELDIIKQLNKQKQGEPPAYGLNGLNRVSGNVLIQTDVKTVTSFLTSEPSPQCDSVVATAEKEIPST